MITDYIYVWRSKPGAVYGLVPMVRAANGQSESASDGFNFAHNYTAWCDHLNAHLPAWTYFYAGDKGAKVADELMLAAPHAPFYLLDIEDPGVKAAEVAACYVALRRRAPVWLSTWGELSQATSRHVPVSAAHWDVITPQQYYPYQQAVQVAYQKYCTRVVPSIAPADNGNWRTIAKRGPVAVWSYNTVNVEKMAAALAALSGRTNTAPARAAIADSNT